MGKIYDEEKEINPVVIVLETQAEVDQLFAVMNYTAIKITLSDSNLWWQDVYDFLLAKKSTDFENYHIKLENNIKKTEKQWAEKQCS